VTPAAPLAHIDGTARWSIAAELRTVVTGQAATVRLTPYWTEGKPLSVFRTVLILDADGRELPLMAGGQDTVHELLRSVFPDQWFDQPLDYDVTSGALTVHRSNWAVAS
jgi:hypothetical protein